MAKMKRSKAEVFADAVDAMLQGNLLAGFQADAFEIRLAERLHATGADLPDPAFIEGLRQELQLRAGMRERKAAETLLGYATMETPLGTIAIAHRDGCVLYCTRIEDRASLERFERSAALALGDWPHREASLPAGIERGVREHLAGKRRFTAIDLSWLPPFQRQVLEKTSEIPRGEVRPYGWIAREIGVPGATRAVGTALGHNPVPFIIPCHRVVRADGSLGEYSGGGPAVKRRVLELEGAPVADLQAGYRAGERLRGSRTTHIVCYPSCHAARRIRPEHMAPFTSLRQAEADGYRPCERCRPA